MFEHSSPVMASGDEMVSPGPIPIVRHTTTPSLIDCDLDRLTPRTVADDDEPSVELLCPITHALMMEPVVIASGHTFEKAAIEAWFSRSNTNPLTGEALSHTHTIPNISVRTLCKDYLSQRK